MRWNIRYDGQKDNTNPPLKWKGATNFPNEIENQTKLGK